MVGGMLKNTITVYKPTHTIAASGDRTESLATVGTYPAVLYGRALRYAANPDAMREAGGMAALMHYGPDIAVGYRVTDESGHAYRVTDVRVLRHPQALQVKLEAETT